MKTTQLTEEQYKKMNEFTYGSKIVQEKDMGIVNGLEILGMVDVQMVNGGWGNEQRFYRVTLKKVRVYECKEVGVKQTRLSQCKQFAKKLFIGDLSTKDMEFENKKGYLVERLNEAK